MGALNVRQILQRVAGRLGLPQPTSVFANTDPLVVQMLSVLNQFPEDLQTRHSKFFDASLFTDVTTGAMLQYPTKDTDVLTCPDALPLAYIKWKWKSDKGLEYAEDFAAYERLVTSWILYPENTVIDITAAGGHQYEVVAPSLNQRPWGFRRY